MDLGFLKDLFTKGGMGGGVPGPQVLPGASAPPSKGSDIANLLARLLGGAGAGMSAMEGFQPQQAPPALTNRPRMPGAGAAPPGGDPTVTGLLKRIFGQQNTLTPAQPPSNQIPTGTPPAGGTGGLY